MPNVDAAENIENSRMAAKQLVDHAPYGAADTIVQLQYGQILEQHPPPPNQAGQGGSLCGARPGAEHDQPPHEEARVSESAQEPEPKATFEEFLVAFEEFRDAACVPEAPWANRAFVLAAAPTCTSRGVLCMVPAAFCRDREIVLEAVKHDGLDLEYASPELRADREIVHAAVKHNRMALKHVQHEPLRAALKNKCSISN